MAISITYPNTLPSLSDPATFNARASQLFSWITGQGSNQLLGELAAITGADVVTFQSSPTDTTAGRALAVGAFGLGATDGLPAPSDDADLCVIPGFCYRFPTDGLNTPVGNPFGYTLHVFAGTGGNRLQQLFVDTSGNSMWLRASLDGGATWSDWRLFYSQSNVISAVSETSGTPTGGLMERGSNANGSYHRYADGLQVCFTSQNSSNSGSVTWAYPSAFSSAPYVGVTPGSTSARIATVEAIGTSSAGFNCWAADGTTRITVSCRLLALGRWY